MAINTEKKTSGNTLGAHWFVLASNLLENTLMKLIKTI